MVLTFFNLPGSVAVIHTVRVDPRLLVPDLECPRKKAI